MLSNSRRFNDYLFRWIGIPVTGILAFILSGLLDSSYQQASNIYPGALYFVFISFALWHSNMLVSTVLKKRTSSNGSIFIKFLIRYAITIVVSFSISYIFLMGWNILFQPDGNNYSHFQGALLILIFISIIVSSIYEIIYLSKEKDYNVIKAQKSKQLEAHAQLEVLKSQIDPHFIFNSLNTLSYLISTDAVKARLFNDTLAKVYRYILVNKEKDLVQLREEIEFASLNYYLLRIRYQEGLHLHIKLDNIIAENFFIPPLSLQTLVENAIKHNHFSRQLPLSIEISISEDYISVTNNKKLKKFDVVSSKIGLINLNSRYRLIASKNITIKEAAESFSVLLPMINCEQ